MFKNPFETNIEKQLEELRQQQVFNPNNKLNGYFGKLQDFIQTTDKARVDFANNSEEVIDKYKVMTDVFILYLLENSRPQFENWCNNRGLNVVEDYVNTFIAKTNDYVEPRNEIDSLKAQIEELKGLLNK